MIIVTRPSPYGEELVKQLEEIGITAKHVPLFSIEPTSPLTELQTKLDRLSHNDMVIVVSPQVIHSLENADEPIHFPSKLRYAAIGKKTANLLQRRTGKTVLFPTIDENSEALLSLPALQQVSQQRILILRGNNGRELLASILQSRGAQTDYFQCYKREVINYELSDIQRWSTNTMITITNIESLIRLNELVSTSQRTLCRLLVSSPRIGNKAKQLGWLKLVQTDSANNEILFKTISTLCHNG